MKASRREAIAAALAVPALAAVPRVVSARAGGTVFVHDPALEVAAGLAAAHPGRVLAIEGDRIRFARALFEGRPAVVVGVSRPADALLIEEVAREAGYAPAPFDALQESLASSPPRDRGLVLGWALARSRS